MDKPRHQQQPGYETVPQPFVPDQASARFLPLNPNASDVKPVHNYSIQTGEEFSLEFMRDRVIPQRSSNPNGAGDMNHNNTTGYMELRGLLGISHAGSDCASDVSRLSAAENGFRDYDRTNPSVHEFDNKLGHVQSAPQGSISKDRSLGNLNGYAASSASGSVTAKVKILCSFGGKILPRPGDSKLRYVGGETHIISVRKDISWLALKQKILEIYYQTHVVKYQLPGEDLDALVSVSCEEDLQNMFEEYYEMENRGGSQKLRMFLFSINDLDDDALLGVNRNDGDSEFQYVVAVNGMDIGLGRNSILNGRDSSSANNLAELDVRNNEGNNNVTGDVVGVSVPQVMANGFQQSSGQQAESIPPSSTLHYSQSVPPGAAYQLQQPVPPSSTLHYSQSIPPSSSVQYPQSITPDSSFQYPQSITPDSSFQYPQSITPGVYRSERIPREQLELLNRLSKSDDSLGSQFLTSQSQTSYAQQDGAKEAVGKSHEDSQNVNGDAAHQKHKNVETVFRNDTLDSEHLRKIANPDDANKNRIVNGTGTEIDVSNSSHVIPEEQDSTRRSDSLQGDILIDINDRFPRDFLSEIFSKAISEDTSSVHPYPHDGAAVSMNVQNHDPKNWSYFQQLAEQQFIQRDVASIDQADSHFPSDIKDGGESSRLHHVTPLSRDGISTNLADPQLTLGRDYEDDNGGGTSTILPTPEDDQMKVTESEEFGAMVENLRMPDSEPKDEKKETRQAALTPLGSESDYDGLQIIKNEDLEELKELGSGTFGTVYHGKWRGSDVAIKRIKKSCFAGRSSEQERLTGEFWGEADILSKLHHPNVVAFYGVVKDGPGGTLATVTEYMVDGSLRHVLVRRDRHLDRRKRLIIAMDAAFGMEYLHSKNIVHFDLKCDNLLVNLKDPSRPICKVGDFGLSKIKRNTLVSGGVRGTLPWMAPELLNGSSSKVSEKVDVFSFGIVLWEILTGEEPYANMHYGAIIGGIVNNTLRPTIPAFCDDEWRTLMEECWAPNPTARPSFTEVAGRLRVMSSAATSTQSKPPTHRASR
ncbi:hypothetical protein BRARA_G02073 [Brassica rapa]|uniref:Protein kinase domain-containing protein n=1 Tax=Brassica campestris TaxID=3711 RepID=A0A397YPW7_BRACM|nr:hypothetical protein BRARA_G02073 [Brassica rapa]